MYSYPIVSYISTISVRERHNRFHFRCKVPRRERPSPINLHRPVVYLPHTSLTHKTNSHKTPSSATWPSYQPSTAQATVSISAADHAATTLSAARKRSLSQI